MALIEVILCNYSYILNSMILNIAKGNDFGCMKFIYLHSGEETNLRDPRS